MESCPVMIEYVDKIVDMRRHLTLEKGAVAPWAKSNPPSPYYLQVLASVGRAYGFTLKSKWADLSEEQRHAILFGTGSRAIPLRFEDGRKAYEVVKTFEGVIRKALKGGEVLISLN